MASSMSSYVSSLPPPYQFERFLADGIVQGPVLVPPLAGIGMETAVSFATVMEPMVLDLAADDSGDLCRGWSSSPAYPEAAAVQQQDAAQEHKLLSVGRNLNLRKSGFNVASEDAVVAIPISTIVQIM